MSLPNGAHVAIDGTYHKLDEDYEAKTGRRCYVHGGRSIFAGRTDITGKPGAQNLKEDYLVTSYTRWDGEGQVVFDPADNDSAFRFYRSEGLNFRVPGQASLNKALRSETVSTTSATTTWQGNADFADITGTSTTSATDRKLVAVGDKIAATSNLTPGASNVTMDYYIYTAPFSDYSTTIQATSFLPRTGAPVTSGTDLVMSAGDGVASAKLTVGSELVAGQTTRVELYASTSAVEPQPYSLYIVEVTGQDELIAKLEGVVTTAAGTPFRTVTFIPRTSGDYRIYVFHEGSPSSTFTFDKVAYGADVTSNSATIEVYNQTDSITTASRVVDVTVQAVGGSSPGVAVASISFQGVAAKNYRPRLTRTSGKQALWADKVTANVLTAASWTIDCLDLGLGTQSAGVFTPSIWAHAHAPAVDSRGFVYNPSTDVWDSVATLDTATGSDITCRAMAHSDAAEYFLLSSGEVVYCTAAGADTLNLTTISGPVGMTIAQDRLWVLDEGAAGTKVYSAALEGGSLGDITVSATARVVTINTGAKSPDTSLRQRMCSAPTGARFFVNYGDVTAKVYEVDGSGASLAARELADLGHGVKATCIAHEGGITFIGAQYYGDNTSSDTDKKPRSVLFAIDQNGVLQRIGFFREDSPDVRPPQFIVPYQTDLYILQGNYVWRYDLVNGGIFLEYELSAATPGNQRALAVLFGRIFAGFTTEIFVAGSLGTYRRSSASGGNTVTSSITDFGLPAVTKTLAKIDVLTDTLPAATQVAIEYQIDQSGTWVLAGQMTSGTQQTFYIEGVSFSTLQVRARLSSSDGVSTPVLKAVTTWASSSQDEEYFDLVVLTEDQDSSFRIDGEQATGASKADAIVSAWRNKRVISFTDGYLKDGVGDSYLVTIEDVRVEQIADREGRTVLTLRVVR